MLGISSHSLCIASGPLLHRGSKHHQDSDDLPARKHRKVGIYMSNWLCLTGLQLDKKGKRPKRSVTTRASRFLDLEAQDDMDEEEEEEGDVASPLIFPFSSHGSHSSLSDIQTRLLP